MTDSTVALVEKGLCDNCVLSSFKAALDMEVGQQTALCQDWCNQMYSLFNYVCQPVMWKDLRETGLDAVEPSVLVRLFACFMS